MYKELLEAARERLENGESVILDASWISSEEHARAAQLAADTQTALLTICCRCDDSIGADRITQRLAVGGDVSEATVAVRDVMEAGLDEWTSALVIDTSPAAASVNFENALSGLVPSMTPGALE